MTATFYITHNNSERFDFSYPIYSRKQARQVMDITVLEWQAEGWQVKEEGEWELLMARGVNEPVFRFVIG